MFCAFGLLSFFPLAYTVSFAVFVLVLVLRVYEKVFLSTKKKIELIYGMFVSLENIEKFLNIIVLISKRLVTINDFFLNFF